MSCQKFARLPRRSTSDAAIALMLPVRVGFSVVRADETLPPATVTLP